MRELEKFSEPNGKSRLIKANQTRAVELVKRICKSKEEIGWWRKSAGGTAWNCWAETRKCWTPCVCPCPVVTRLCTCNAASPSCSATLSTPSTVLKFNSQECKWINARGKDLVGPSFHPSKAVWVNIFKAFLRS